jgi:hypothetical protein
MGDKGRKDNGRNKRLERVNVGVSVCNDMG